MIAHRGLTASQPWMRADPHAGPELKLHIKAEYIDAALTFVSLPTSSLPTSSCDARPDHTSWHFRDIGRRAALGRTPDLTGWPRSAQDNPTRTIADQHLW